MKKIILSFISATLLLTSCSSQTAGPINSMKDSTAYALGVILGANAKMAASQNNFEKPHVDVMSKAVNDAFSGDEEKLQEALIYLNTSQMASQARQLDSTFSVAMIIKGLQETIDEKGVIKAEDAGQFIMKYIGEKGKAEQESYFAEVDKTEGIQKTENGIRYIIEKQGEGVITDSDRVSVNYTLFNYQEDTIDSSIKRGTPLKVQLPNGVVPGFAQAIQLVGVGGKIMVWIPSELGYGENGAGGDIAPYQALKFDIEVIEKLPAEEKVEAKAK